MLVINPDERIDWAVCVPECPIDASKPDSDAVLAPWVELNRNYARRWPNITEKGIAPADAKAMEGLPNTLRDLFSEQPGEGS